MNQVYLRSRRPRALQGSYSHKLVCTHAESDGCLCQTVTRPGYDGTEKPVREEASFYIPPKSASGPYPSQILLVPQVALAIKNKEIILDAQRVGVERIGG